MANARVRVKYTFLLYTFLYSCRAAEEDFSKDLPDEKTDEEVKDLFYGAAFPLFKGAQFVAKLPGFKGLLNRFGPVIASMSFNKVIKPSFINMNKFTVRPIDSAIHFVDPYLSPFRVYDFEMAFDCPADCTAVLKATQSVRDILKKEAKKGNIILIFNSHCSLVHMYVYSNRYYMFMYCWIIFFVLPASICALPCLSLFVSGCHLHSLWLKVPPGYIRIL